MWSVTPSVHMWIEVRRAEDLSLGKCCGHCAEMGWTPSLVCMSKADVATCVPREYEQS